MEPSSQRGSANRPSSSAEARARPRLDARIEAGIALLAAVVALTCAGSGAIARSGQSKEKASARELAPAASVRPTASETTPVPARPPAPAITAQPRELERFFAALGALERHERKESVRILWLGDSHTAADYMTGKVRELLVQRYGAGGPGFVRLGLAGYRHELATPARVGRFTIEPFQPAQRKPQGDGCFGLGGIRAIPSSDGARLTLKLSPRALPRGGQFTLLFELRESSAFTVSAGARTLLVDESAAWITRAPDSPIQRLTLEAELGESLVVDVTRGRPRFYGVIVEASEPGLVLDTAGIDGARLATPLAWAEAPFVAEVAARKPELVVLAYGTNEAFDRANPKIYETELRSLLDRLRRGAPAADCLVLGPPDALAKGGDSEPRIPEIAAAQRRTAESYGCLFVSLQALMGGPGSFVTWLRADPPLARPDRIHLTPKGYWRLGELLAGAAFGEASPALSVKNSP